MSRWIERKGAGVAILTAIAFAAGACALWRLWEQDVWWQVRAGNELLSRFEIPRHDTWSYTAAGGPWLNFEWLATIVIALTHRMGGVPALVLLRGVMAGAIVAVAAAIVLRRIRAAGAHACLAWALVPLVFLGLSPRLQARSDTLVMLAFAILVALWDGSSSVRRKRAVTVLLVLLSANLHAGTAPFVLTAAVAFTLADDRPLLDEIAWLLAYALAFLATPYHVAVVPWLWRHILYDRYNLIPNPDHQPMGISSFDLARRGAWAPAWVIVTGLAAAGVMALRASRRRRLCLGACLLLLSLMALARDRAVPYGILFGLPFAADRISRVRGLRIATAILVCLLLSLHALGFPGRYGLGLDARLFPVDAVHFLERAHPSPQLLHMQGDGNYLLGVGGYPVFMDTRESMYRSLQATYRDMVNSPALMADVVHRYGVKTVLYPMSFFRRPFPGGGSVRAAFFPKKDWALVHFDEGWMVLVARGADHASLIERYEYRLYVPYREPWAYFDSRERSPENDARFAAEVSRCRAEVPSYLGCEIAEALVWWERGEHQPARARLNALAQGHPDSVWLHAALERTLHAK